MASSSTASCSPPPACRYNLRSKRAKTTGKMASNRANRDDATREVEVDSAPKKKSGSIEEYLRDISKSVAMHSQRKLSREPDELDRVLEILEEDGIQEGSDIYCMAIFLCKNAMNRRVFTTMKTKEGRLHWIQFNWANK